MLKNNSTLKNEHIKTCYISHQMILKLTLDTKVFVYINRTVNSRDTELNTLRKLLSE